jgi:hypothetical protein
MYRWKPLETAGLGVSRSYPVPTGELVALRYCPVYIEHDLSEAGRLLS